MFSGSDCIILSYCRKIRTLTPSHLDLSILHSSLVVLDFRMCHDKFGVLSFLHIFAPLLFYYQPSKLRTCIKKKLMFICLSGLVMITKYRIYICVVISFLAFIVKITNYDLFSWAFISGLWGAMVSIAILPFFFGDKGEKISRD